MLYQCAPDPEDVIAQRRLPDGRVLAVFRLVEERRSVKTERVVTPFVAGEVIVDMVRTRQVTEWGLETVGYALVVTDDVGLVEKWRTLAQLRTRDEAFKLFDEFREGMDERRKVQSGGHPRRRASDTRREQAG